MTALEQRAWTARGRELRAVTCNLCGSDEPRRLAVENGLTVARCERCGLVYVTPQPSGAELARFYDAYFPEESESDWRRVWLPAFRRDAIALEARAGGTGRVLDVGTGFGHFLELMRDRGWEVAAVEASATAARRLGEKGIRVFAGRAPDVDVPESHFDAITASSVLEHVSDPIAVLEKARRWLRPGGWLLVRVPNVELLSLFFPIRRFERAPLARAAMRVLRKEIMDEQNLFHVIDPPAHLFGFSQRTLRAALERTGFGDVSVRGDPMPERGNALNAVIDGLVYGGAGALRALSGGRIQLAPNLVALAQAAGARYSE